MTERNSGSFGDVPTKEKPGFWKWIYIGKAQLLIVSGLRQSRANEDEFRIEKRVCWGWINFGNDGLLRMNLSWKSGAFDCDLTRAKQDFWGFVSPSTTFVASGYSIAKIKGTECLYLLKWQSGFLSMPLYNVMNVLPTLLCPLWYNHHSMQGAISMYSLYCKWL